MILVETEVNAKTFSSCLLILEVDIELTRVVRYLRLTVCTIEEDVTKAVTVRNNEPGRESALVEVDVAVIMRYSVAGRDSVPVLAAKAVIVFLAPRVIIEPDVHDAAIVLVITRLTCADDVEVAVSVAVNVNVVGAGAPAPGTARPGSAPGEPGSPREDII
jgi:hypothetical protein